MSFDPAGIATIFLDVPGKSVNTLSQQALADLGEAVYRVEQHLPKAVIFASAKPRSFVAGADLGEINTLSPERLDHYLADGQALFTRIEDLACPTVAAINGDCLGGGLELALSCNARVASDSTSINIGLPETKLGILPGWGGTVRLPRLIGLAEALALMLAGKTLTPAKARGAGIVDDLAPAEALMSAARRLALNPPEHRKPSFVRRALGALPFVRRKIFAAAKARTLEQTYGNYPAPLRLLEVVRTGWEQGPHGGFDAERRALVELMQTEAARNLIRLFFLRQGARKAIAEQIHAKPAEVKHAAVVGGGTMGAGIAYLLARAGISVRLIEVDPGAASAAIARVQASFDDDVQGARLSALDATQALDRVASVAEWTELQFCDVVIEAVIEKMGVKRAIFAKLDGLVRPDCVLATNTSSLSVSEIAAATATPARVVGLHFFNPAPKMPLVEVIRADKTGDQALATAAGLAARIGKTAVLVKDSPGFLVNRVLIPYLAEASALAGEGTPIAMIDDAMKKWGMPMGPFELIDEIGLDVSEHILKSLSDQLGHDRVPTSSGIDRALEKGWLGKKSGTGFYVYGKEKGQKPQLNPELATIMGGRTPADHSIATVEEQEQIAWRLVLAMVNELARLLEEGVVESTDTADLAMVLGTGLAPFRGGLVRFVDSVGVPTIVKRLEELQTKHGSRFVPAKLLRELVDRRSAMSDFFKLAQEA
jgi:3-hydroxyacyl-CoA dehydrogenase/enoyl-CoA hydratase/3-hydroxybutyryl-CoA epimerase